MLERLPTFVFCKDGKYYENLVYQDFPQRRAWFVCFSANEPAEIVVREEDYKALRPEELLKHRGFDCLTRLLPGRREPHLRFFGEEHGKPTDGHKAISWWMVLKKGAPLPTPVHLDSCVKAWPVFPNRKGAYFGVNR